MNSWRATIAVIWGLLMGGLTFALGQISVLSDNRFFAALQMFVGYLLLPGAVTAAISGSFVPGAVITFAFHLGLCLLILRLATRSQKKSQVE